MAFTYVWESESDFKKASAMINTHLETIKKRSSQEQFLIEFIQDTLPFLETKWNFFVISPNPMGGRRRVSRLSLFYIYIYLLYFTKDWPSRVFRKINKNCLLREILLLNSDQITRPTFYRFVNWLYQDNLTQIFDSIVLAGIQSRVITLESHIIDSGKINANVNWNRFLSFPYKHHERIIDLYNEIDWISCDILYSKHPRLQYLISSRLKLLLLPYIAGIPSYTLIYTFLRFHPVLQLQLGLGCRIPTRSDMHAWIKKKYFNSQLESYFRSLFFPISCYLFSKDYAVLPRKLISLEDIYGACGKKYSRVDRGARIGYKSSDKSTWVGYKDHISIDADSGLPVLVTITSANVHDSLEYIPHLKTLKDKYQDLVRLKYSYADKGYDAADNRDACSKIWGSFPCISQRKASTEQRMIQKTWSSTRQRVEQTISRVVLFTKKNNPRFRGKSQVTTWVQMGYLIILMIGLRRFLNGEPELARCTNLYLD